MSFDIIPQLRAATPASRPLLLEAVYKKNVSFFSSKYPALIRFIQQSTCPYRLDITETFVNVVDERSGLLAHPEAGLDRFAEMLGGWTHEAWVDLFNFQIPMLDRYPKHHKLVQNFSARLNQAFPEFSDHLASCRINLKDIDHKRKFSPPVVFLGIFHGLHITHYLQHTTCTTALFIEPEPERFEVSCYFLDYAEIEKQFGILYLAIGEETTAPAIESFFSLLHVTPLLWTRVLCGYPFDKAHFFIETLKSLQVTNTNMLFPLDNELKSLMHGVITLDQGLPLLTRHPKVSRQCKIAVVATGPSLERDLIWLKKNQHKIIIFAVHSAVAVLRKHGIMPDFQFNLDAVINYDFTNTLQMFPEVPLVTDYKAPPHILADFERPLLCADAHKNSVVHFQTSLTDTHPSTTNLAFSFACFLHPETIYLVGCDFGYRKLSHNHATGSFYEENRAHGMSISYAEEALQSLVEPNFAGTEPIQTISQHLRTKIVIEKCIAAKAQNIDVFNLSDGALITGAQPQRSSETYLTRYTRKREDIKEILKAFSPAKEKENWEVYSVTGAARLYQLKDDLINALTLESFSWQKFSQSIDAALKSAFLNNRKNEHDHRMHIYSRVLNDLLCLWYRCLIFFDNTETASKIYTSGLLFLKESLEELEWPEVFDHDQHTRMENRLAPEWKIYLAQLYARKGNITHAEALIHDAYLADPDLKNGFSRLGWLETEKGHWAEGFALMVQDEASNRISPAWKVDLAQLYGRENQFDHAVKLIKSAYADDATLKNGFTRLGLLKSANKEWKMALALAVPDLTSGRLSPFSKTNIAELFGRTGDFVQAQALVTAAYAESPVVKDGFAKLGWIKQEIRDWAEAHVLFLKDRTQERLSPYWTINMAIVKGCLQQWNEALDLVAEAYEKDSSLCDGYSRLGWMGYMLGMGSNFFGKKIDKDKQLNRSSVYSQLYQAMNLTINKKHDRALHIIEKTYKIDPMLKNWFSAIGWLHITLGNTKNALELMERDINHERMDDTWLPNYAITLGMCGKKNQAMKILEKKYFTIEKDSTYRIGYASIPDSFMKINQLKEFVYLRKNFNDIEKFK